VAAIGVAAALALAVPGASADATCPTLNECGRQCESGDLGACDSLRAGLTAMCEHDVAEACATLGELYWEGHMFTPVAVATGVKLERKACELGHGGACNQWAFALAYGQGVPRDDARAVTVWKRGCELDNGLSCGTYGSRLRLGRGIARDDKLAGEVLIRGCALQDPTGCTQLGFWHDEHGRGDDARAAWRRACGLGGFDACAKLQRLGESPAGAAADPAVAHAAYVRECDHEVPMACAHVADDYRSGRGVKASPQIADAIDARTCDTGFPPSCEQLGRAAADRGELASADRWLSRACELGLASACRDAGDVRRRRGTRDAGRTAMALYQRGCDANDPESCFAVGRLLEAGDGVKRSAPRALAAYVRACDGALVEACVAGARLGRGAKATKLRTKACDLGDRPSCAPR